MPKVQKPGEGGFFKGLFYGRSGVGKTVLAASAEDTKEMQHVLFIDVEGGTKSLRRKYSHVDVVTVNSFEQFNEIYDFLRRHIALRKLLKQDKTAKQRLLKLQAIIKDSSDLTLYNTAVLDSLTEIQKQIMMKILDVDIATISFDEDIPYAHRKEWILNGETVRLLVRSFRNLEMNVIFTALDGSKEDETTNEVRVLPSLPGKLAGEISGLLDVVGYLYIPRQEEDEEPRTEFTNVLLVQPTGKYDAKDRYDLLGQFIKDPTMSKIVKKIKEGYK